ncbi:MAG: VOC family protein, partial [Clostridia bacterium]|nr:VOC family protein [Clostridia bacterium]
MKMVPTLNFGGNCREAIQLYAQAFGGQIACLITYRQSGDPAYLPKLTEEQKDWIYHAELLLDDQRIIMSDHADIQFTTCYSNFLTLMYDTKEQVQQAYEVLKE